MELRQRIASRRESLGRGSLESSKEETSSSTSTLYQKRYAPLIVLFTSSIFAVSYVYTSTNEETPLQVSPQESPKSSLETPYCLLSSPDAIRAIRRAKTSSCKDQISLMSCRSQNGSLYAPGPLSNHCPNTVDKELHGKHLGCYTDTVSQRILPDKLFKFPEDNSPSRCIQACSFYGFVYAGLQFRKECFCGNKALESSTGKCDLPCPKPEDGICGGYLSMNVYHTGIKLESNSGISEHTAHINRPVRIVFLLTLSGRSLRQVRRLLRRIYSPSHYYFVHIDSRRDYLHRELSVLESSHSNFQLVPKRFATIWGGSSLLSMLLFSMESLLKNTQWKEWDYMLNLSESDYPLKPLSDLHAFLSANRGKNFVKSHGRDSSVFIQKQGLERTFFECENRMWRIGSRKLPSGITLDGGSDWICLHREFITYIVNNIETDHQLSSLRRLYNFTLLPAESFFHTVLRNSKLCSTYVNNNLHLTNWKRKLGCKCQHKAVVDWCGCSPNDITPLDWPKVKASVDKDIYFVRKVEPVVSQSILDLIDSELLGLNEVIDDRYWQSIWHHEDRQVVSPPERIIAESLIPRGSVLKEIHSFHRNDSLEGILVLFGSSDGRLSEILIRPKALSRTIRMERDDYVIMEIGSAFDPKELIFRNFFKAFGGGKGLGVKLSYRSAAPREMSFLWIDPAGSLVKAVPSKLNASTSAAPLVQYEELGIPDMPGVWKVIPLVDGRVKRGISLLVLDNHHPRERLTPRLEGVSFNLTELIPLSFPKEQEEEEEESLSSLLEEFYPILDSCIGNCSTTTDWSSLVPDPKSSFT